MCRHLAASRRNVAVTAEVGIDGGFPRPWTEEIVRAADGVVTVGCGGRLVTALFGSPARPSSAVGAVVATAHLPHCVLASQQVVTAATRGRRLPSGRVAFPRDVGAPFTVRSSTERNRFIARP